MLPHKLTCVSHFTLVHTRMAE